MVVDDGTFSLPFAGGDLDRASTLRKNPSQLRDRLADPRSRVLVVRSSGEVPQTHDGALVWLSSEVCPYEIDRMIFIGLDPAGHGLFAVVDDDRHIEAAHFASLRDIALHLEAVEAAAAAAVVALVSWHQRTPFCCVCGSPTEIGEAGHIRSCPTCSTVHFPRMDTAVIMLVSDGDRCVLGRRSGSSGNRWSNLAGFVEAGESPESAVVREVYEEVGLRVHGVRYRGSQPWPFPASLMLAYEAYTTFGDLGLNEEHSEVRWFTRAELQSGIAEGSIARPSMLSAGGHLILDWLSKR